MTQVDLDLTTEEDEPSIVFGYQTQEGDFVPIEQCFQTNLRVHYRRLQSQRRQQDSEVKEIDDDTDDDDEVGLCESLSFV